MVRVWLSLWEIMVSRWSQRNGREGVTVPRPRQGGAPSLQVCLANIWPRLAQTGSWLVSCVCCKHPAHRQIRAVGPWPQEGRESVKCDCD